jgi:hypothetical protein
MADDSSARKQQGLQQAASVIFALVAIVPLLIFAWTLFGLGALRQTRAQLGLAVALTVALLGFWMFRVMLHRMSEVVRALAAAVEQASRTRRPPASTPAPTPAPAHGVAAAASAAATAVLEAPPVQAPATVVARAPLTGRPAAGAARAVPGMGDIRELTEVMRTMDALWHREATAYLGRRVQVSVANSREPLIGTLSEASTDGLVLEQPDGPVPIAYGRIASIDRLT